MCPDDQIAIWETELGRTTMKIGAVMFFTTDSMQPQDLAPALEERGFESLWVPAPPPVPLPRLVDYPGGGPLPRPYYDIYDPFMALNTVATVTTQLKIGTGIALVVQRDPIVTAKMVSSIDQLSKGRFLFGVGNGWNRDEIENHGTNFSTRNKLARERIEAMIEIWTKDEPSYEGEFVKFGPMSQWPKPFQKPYPPVIVGGAFPYSARRAIRYGDGWIPQAARGGYKEIADMFPDFRKMCGEAGRDPASLAITVWFPRKDPDLMKRYQDLGVERVVFNLESEPAEKIQPELD